MASNNIQMPMFAPSSQQDGGGGWNEVDHFDVDILAEYLLGDGSLPSTGGGVTFDFMYVPVVKVPKRGIEGFRALGHTYSFDPMPHAIFLRYI
jgi:hypothetical protein